MDALGHLQRNSQIRGCLLPQCPLAAKLDTQNKVKSVKVHHYPDSRQLNFLHCASQT